MSQYNKLFTPKDSAVVFIDHQPQMTFGVANIDRADAMLRPLLAANHRKLQFFRFPFNDTGDTPARELEARLVDCRGLPEPGDVDYAAP